jgi:hypothetical protein
MRVRGLHQTDKQVDLSRISVFIARLIGLRYWVLLETLFNDAVKISKRSGVECEVVAIPDAKGNMKNPCFRRFPLLVHVKQR